MVDVNLEEVQKAIDRGNEEYLAALIAKDPIAYSNVFTENGALMMPNQSKLQGREHIRQQMEKSFSQSKNEMRGGEIITLDLFHHQDNQVFETGKYTFRYTTPEDEKLEQKGKFVVLWERDNTDTW